MHRQLGPGSPFGLGARLGSRSIVLVGLMGAGKTTVGRRLAQILDLPFKDTDAEIETVSRMTVPELFTAYGEPEFRALEARVVTRLAADGPQVLATGGGAFMNAETRQVLSSSAVTVWLKADLDILMERVARRGNRPLLKAADPRAVMQDLMDKRYPVYAAADITIASRNVKREVIADEIAEALDRFLAPAP
ncbi:MULTISPECIES: shikimate kinase [unclassified Aureimonas]|uniref:shikimate kinase n=1 Tax=unclassified Aureimonas TaxID=2615206 RepID=UPI0006FF4C27|nr:MULTISPECIES: shikimate kinase [unclassified Aureimonas]KQT53995.1 shikimate kinase [Aureimonas sp. Leaf427]KQT71565.1 shikimate kinase [Aureimonas sp. Leaf460]